jgi:hypothetical protein
LQAWEAGVVAEAKVTLVFEVTGLHVELHARKISTNAFHHLERLSNSASATSFPRDSEYIVVTALSAAFFRAASPDVHHLIQPHFLITA